jgi:hypothetical protein
MRICQLFSLFPRRRWIARCAGRVRGHKREVKGEPSPASLTSFARRLSFGKNLQWNDAAIVQIGLRIGTSNRSLTCMPAARDVAFS